jgi:hypothetical protein
MISKIVDFIGKKRRPTTLLKINGDIKKRLSTISRLPFDFWKDRLISIFKTKDNN